MVSKTEIKQLTKIFKALSNENRLQLFLEILEKDNLSINQHDCFISELANHLKIGAPTISHHVKELENAGLIHTDKKGKLITANVNKEVINIIVKMLS